MTVMDGSFEPRITRIDADATGRILPLGGTLLPRVDGRGWRAEGFFASRNVNSHKLPVNLIVNWFFARGKDNFRKAEPEQKAA